jgi:NCAIR mutase (PurE)-related protein
MTITDEFVLDTLRDRRVRISEALFCAGKSPAQIVAIVEHAEAKGISLLLTRLDATRFDELAVSHRETFDYDPVSSTVFAGAPLQSWSRSELLLLRPARRTCRGAEAIRTLRFAGFDAEEIIDVGVAGLWRLLRRAEEIARFPVVIVAAGMDAALPSVIGGLVPGLASCALGLVTVNIDNGYGAACAAIRALGGRTQPKEDDRGET